MTEVLAVKADVLRLAAQTTRLRADHLDLLAELYRDHLPREPEYEQMAEDAVGHSVPYYLAGPTRSLGDHGSRPCARVRGTRDSEWLRKWTETRTALDDLLPEVALGEPDKVDGAP